MFDGIYYLRHAPVAFHLTSGRYTLNPLSVGSLIEVRRMDTMPPL